MKQLYWVSADKQASVRMGEYASEDAAADAIPAMQAELLGQCATEEQRAQVLVGLWEIL